MLNKLSFFLLFAVLTCGQIASAQVPRQGGCPNVKNSDILNWYSFQGVWYEYAKYPIFSELGEKCVYSKYTHIANNTVGIKVSGLNTSNQPFSSDITGKVTGPAVLSVTLASGTNQVVKILAVDYELWAIMYSCQNIGKDGEEYAWILSRHRNLHAETVSFIEKKMFQHKVLPGYLQKTIQSDCPAN